MNEPIELTPEQKIFLRWEAKKQEARDAELEAKNIRDTEIVPMLKDGLYLEADGEYVRWETKTTPKFDFAKARADGKIPDDVWKDYMTVDVSLFPMCRNVKDESAVALEKQINEKVAALIKELRGK